jgi:hypothetical protein
MVFSSSPAVYGTPEGRCGRREHRRMAPVALRGEKARRRVLVRDQARVTGLCHTSLRYFNVVSSGAPSVMDTSPHNLFPCPRRARAGRPGYSATTTPHRRHLRPRLRPCGRHRGRACGCGALRGIRRTPGPRLEPRQRHRRLRASDHGRLRRSPASTSSRRSHPGVRGIRPGSSRPARPRPATSAGRCGTASPRMVESACSATQSLVL